MGMSASQARLLFISSRINDVELKSQQISNTKMRLAAQSDQVANDYAQALDKTRLMITDPMNNEKSQLSYSTIMSPGGMMSGAYNLQTADGKLIVSSKEATAFDKCGGSYENFLQRLLGTPKNTSVSQAEKDAAQKRITTAQNSLTTAQNNLKTAEGSVTTTNAIYQTKKSEASKALTAKNAAKTALDAAEAGLGAKDEAGAKAYLATEKKEGKTPSVKSDGSLNFPTKTEEIKHYKTVEEWVETGDGGSTGSASSGGSTASTGSGGSTSSGGYWKKTKVLDYTEKKTVEIWSTTEKNRITATYKEKLNASSPDAQAKYDAAEAEYTKASEAYSKAQTAENNAKTTYNNAVTTRDKAKTTVTTAQTELNNAKKAYEDLMATDGVTEWDMPEITSQQDTYYKNLFDNLTKNGYQAYSQDALNNPEYLQFQLQQGNWYIGKKDDEGKYQNTSLSSNTLVVEENDTRGHASAEAKYNAETAKINRKEKELDMQLKRLDTEHSALTTEFDSVKSLIGENVEKSFNTFS